MFTVSNILLDATIVTAIDVDVDDDCTNTVTNTPIIRPTIGFCNNSLSWKKFPITRAPSKRNDVLNNSNEQMNEYNNNRMAINFNTMMVI